MLSKTLTSGRIRRADYNPESQQLDLHWDNKSTLAYKQVPQRGVSPAVQRAQPGYLLGRPHCRGIPHGRAHDFHYGAHGHKIIQ